MREFSADVFLAKEMIWILKDDLHKNRKNNI